MKALALILAVGFGFGQAKDGGFPEVAAADAKALEKLKQLGALAMPLAANTNVITVDFRAVAEQVNDATLEHLKPVADQLVWLNLASTKVTDAGLAHLAGLKHLQRLHLEKTGIGDEGLAHLKGLGELRYLNLYGTKVSDKAVAHLAGLKKLENLFLWMTPVTDTGEAELAKALPKTHINRGWKEPPKVEKPAEEKKPEAAAAKPINAKCPLSGKDIDAAATFLYKNQLIAFCCNNCKGKFEKEPGKYIAKVEGFKEPAPAAAAKPINAKCPLSGKDIDAAATFLYKNQLIAFCCNNCKGKFEKEPAKYIAKVEGFKEPAPAAAAKPINAKCPLSGKDIDAAATFLYKNQLIAFCCNNCKGKFEKDPEKFVGKVKEFKP